MSEPTILVTGATGKTGTAVVLQLLAAQQNVRAYVHRLDRRSEALRAAGAEVVAGDAYDPAGLADAMRGATRAYYCAPFTSYMIQSAAAFAVAAREAQLEAIVCLSQWLASPANPALLTRQHWLADRIFAMVPDVAHVSVNPGFFADNYLRTLPLAAHLGLFVAPIGSGRNAPPSNEDIARVAVAALLDPQRHAGKTYRPTGPALLSGTDMAATMAHVLKRPVKHVDAPMPMLLKAMRVMGATMYEQDVSRFYFEEQKRGSFEYGAPTGDVLAVTGCEPEDFETIVRRYASDPALERTFAKKLAALALFMRIGLTLPRDLDAFERDQHFPTLADPEFAIASASWRSEHARPSSNVASLTRTARA